ncbi:hypothetical protein HJG60_009642 [Phyllostomus discolor]|uniref:Uncharacterized protein n=1 Tax=Phyllostomus discolor TaxID=89673 RepID=A0A834EQ84_9CHIR|nr:hypothetical protein HJG60_009642 [Phyllostomus discolor]
MFLLKFSCWFWGGGGGTWVVGSTPVATCPGCCVRVQGHLPPQSQAAPEVAIDTAHPPSQTGRGWNSAGLWPSACGCTQGWAGEAQPHSGPTKLSLTSCRATWGGSCTRPPGPLRPGRMWA